MEALATPCLVVTLYGHPDSKRRGKHCQKPRWTGNAGLTPIWPTGGPSLAERPARPRCRHNRSPPGPTQLHRPMVCDNRGRSVSSWRKCPRIRLASRLLPSAGAGCSAGQVAGRVGSGHWRGSWFAFPIVAFDPTGLPMGRLFTALWSNHTLQSACLYCLCCLCFCFQEVSRPAIGSQRRRD